MILLLKIMFLSAAVNAFNPMDLYVDQKEGFSLTFENDGTKYVWYKHTQWFGETSYSYSYGTTYKQLSSPFPYTRMRVGDPKEDNIYPIESFYWYPPSDYLKTIKKDVKVYANNDGTFSLKCIENGLFATWDNDIGNSEEGEARCEMLEDVRCIPICTEKGICPTCRFTLVVGSITDLNIHIVDLEWGEPEEYFPSSPEQVDEDNMDNYSSTTTTTTLTVTYEGTTTDTTIWEHAWGFELSTSAEVEANIPYHGGSLKTTATASYDGKYGTENTVTGTQSTSNSKTIECPPMTRCTLMFVAHKLDDYNMPFAALVERTQDDGPPMQWTETGIWRANQAFNFNTVYCTTSLETGDTNCPIFNWMK